MWMNFFIAPEGQLYDSEVSIPSGLSSLRESKKEVLAWVLDTLLKAKEYLIKKDSDSLLFSHPSFSYHVELTLEESLENNHWNFHLKRIEKN